MRNVNSKKTKKIPSNFFIMGFLIGMIGIIGAQILFPSLILGASGESISSRVINVQYLASRESINESNVLKALQLEPSFNVSVSEDFSLSTQDCVILDTSLFLNSTSTSLLKSYVENGGNLIMLSSFELTQSPELLIELGIILNGNISDADEQVIVSIPSSMESNVFVRKIEWNSMPEMRNYTKIQVANLNESVEILVERYIQLTDVDKNKDPIIMERALGSGQILFFSGYLGGPESLNQHFKLWPYFNYMIFSSVNYVLNNDYPTYGNWPYSPVPHLSDQLVITVYTIIIAIIAIGAFLILKKRSKASRIDSHTLEATKIMVKKDDEALRIDEEKKRKIEELMKLDLEPVEFYAELSKIAEVDLTDQWEQVGSHRQIGGFLFGFFVGVILIIPQLAITGLLLPRFIMPYPQVNGWFDLTKNFFNALWVAFDVGTSVALAKYFAQYRVKEPEKAIHYIQIFVWWQMLSGVVQVAMVAMIGSFIYPHTYLAHLSWFFILHSLIQYPGFFLVFMFVFQGMQRTDYHLLTLMLNTIIFNILFQIGFILLFRWLFKSMPIFGEEFGAGIGFVLGQYFAQWGTFFFTVLLFKKMGFSINTVFRIDFTSEEFKKALSFGAKFMLGNVWVPAVWLWQVFLQSSFVKGYASETGYFNLIYTFGGIVSVVGLFMEGLLAGVSEAHSHGKKSLLKLHTVQGLKWANYMAFFVVALLAMIGWRFVIGFSGPEWKPAIKFIPWVLIFQILGPYSWEGDKILAGAEKTGYLAIAWVIEQGTRATLLFFMIPDFQMLGVLWAYIPALIAKNIALWAFIYKHVTRPKPYFWVVWISPALSALLIYGCFELIAGFIWTGDIVSTALLFLLGIFGGLYLYAFLTGLLGHWDKNTLQELDKATRMVKIVGFMARSMYHATKVGCKISPLHDRWPLDVFPDAMRDAHELELEKKILKI
ncbi:MAG: hypothetical protein ACTSVI_02530 [Promethearchaeota archaeon]